MLETKIFVVEAMQGWAVLHGDKVAGPFEKDGALAAAQIIAQDAVITHSVAQILLQDGHTFVDICQVLRRAGV